MDHSFDPVVARQQIADAASAMMTGSLSFIEGARQISRLRWLADLPDFDADILPFVGIDSETDALPLGDVRQLWAPDALVKVQPEIERMEQWAAEYARPYCQRLVDRFGTRPA